MCKDRHELKCALSEHTKQNKRNSSPSRSCGSRNYPEHTSTESLIFLGNSINFVYTWLQNLQENYTWHCNAYKDRMKYIFKNPSYTKPVTSLVYLE